MLKNFYRRICAACLAVSLLVCPAGALDRSKVETPFDEALYQIERCGLFAEDHPMSDEQRAACNARVSGGEPLSKVVNEILEKHDSHSFYLTPEEYEQSFSALTGDYVGIGVTVQQLEGNTVITDVNFGGPAREAGVETGDVLLAVDGTAAAGKTLDEIGELLRGNPGTEVRLTLGRAGRELVLSVVRREIYGDYVWSKSLGDGIEYISVEAFATMDDAAHFQQIWEQLDDKRTAAVILDLRGNGGGLIDAALTMLDSMLTEPAEMVTCRWRRDQGGAQVITSDGGGLPLNGIYILVDGKTASAAEMMAACMKDTGTGTLIGEKTYGKSLGQYHLSMGNGDSLIITTLEMSTPKTGVWEGKGVVPDYETRSLITLGEYLDGKPELPTLRPLFFGESSSSVSALTERLHLLGLLDAATGTLTSEVLKAVHVFEEAAGLPHSQNVSVATLRRLNQTMADASGYYVDYALEQALSLARAAAAQPLQYISEDDGSWLPAAA